MCLGQKRLTKRVPDVWDSAAFSSIFLASGFSLSTPGLHAGVPQRMWGRPQAVGRFFKVIVKTMRYGAHYAFTTSHNADTRFC